MSGKFEFNFDYISPFSYVANAAVQQISERTGAEAEFRPIFLGAIMQATGNRPPGMVPAKAAYMMTDLQRCTSRYGLGFRMNPHFPMVSTRKLLRATCGLQDTPSEQRRFIDACFHHMWAAPTPLKPDDEESIRAMCTAEGFDFSRIQELAEDSDNKATLQANTESAIARGAFGAPTFFVGDDMYFGHDRLDYVEEALKAQA